MIVAVTGLVREARLVSGPGIVTVVGGGDAVSLEARLEAELANGAQRVLSIGICGALAPALKTGDAIVASEVIAPGESFPTHGPWSRDLAARIPSAVIAPLAGSDTIVAHRDDKARLRAATHASAADMESHVAARVARRRGLPFAAVRIVSDAAHRSLPPAARVALGADGRIDMRAVLVSLLCAPLQLPALLRTAWEAEIAFAALLRCRDLLDGGLAAADLRQLALDVG